MIYHEGIITIAISETRTISRGFTVRFGSVRRNEEFRGESERGMFCNFPKPLTKQNRVFFFFFFFFIIFLLLIVRVGQDRTQRQRQRQRQRQIQRQRQKQRQTHTYVDTERDGLLLCCACSCRRQRREKKARFYVFLSFFLSFFFLILPLPPNLMMESIIFKCQICILGFKFKSPPNQSKLHF